MTIVKAMYRRGDGPWRPMWRKKYRWRWFAELCNPRPHYLECEDVVIVVEFEDW